VPATQAGHTGSTTSHLGSVPLNVVTNEGHDKSLSHVSSVCGSSEVEGVAGIACKVASNKDIPDEWIGVDIGPETIELFRSELSSCRTILWNGPLGMVENPLYAAGTNSVMAHIASLTRSEGVVSVICGGDTVAAVERQGAKPFSHISTGGGAALEYLQGKVLPGVFALCGETEVMSYVEATTHHSSNHKE